MSPLLWLLVLAPLVILFGWTARRLLGVEKLSGTRTVLAGVLGMGAAWLIAVALERRGATEDTVLVTGAVLAVLFTMAGIVLLEAISRSGARRRGGWTMPRPMSALRRRVDTSRRAAEVTSIAVRHGLGPLMGMGRPPAGQEYTEREIGRRIREALEEAGGVFIKAGQLLATREDVIPAAVARELVALQHEAAPVERSQIEPAIRSQIGAPPDEVFAEFDWDPLGAASLGQVYRARLHRGEAVVVKIRRPGIAATVERDLAIMVDLANQIERRTTWGGQYGIAALAQEFAANLRGELDYHLEAENAASIAAALSDYPSIHVPDVHAEFTTDSVLVLEMLEGATLGSFAATGSPVPGGRDLADLLFRAEVMSMVEGETFHADPHPGNVMLLPDGRLGLLDFGSVGKLDTFERAAVSDILMALHLNDPTLLRDALTGIATVGYDADLNQLERALAKLMAEHLGPGATPTDAMLRDLLAIVNRFGVTMPPSITAMFRALGTLAGTLEVLSPGYPLIDAAQALAGDQLTTMFSPERLNEMAKAELVKLAPILQRLPRHVDRIAGQLERGQLSARVSLFSNRRDVAVVTGLVNRAVLAFAGASLGIVSTMLIQAETDLVLVGTTTLLDVLGYAGLIGGVVLLLRVVLEIVRPTADW